MSIRERLEELQKKVLKNKRKKRRLKYIYVVCLCLSCTIIMLSVAYTNIVARMFRSVSEDSIEAHVKLTSGSIEQTFANSGQLLASIAKSYSLKLSHTDSFIFDNIKLLQASELFDDVCFVDTVGRKYKSNGTLEKVNVDSYVAGVDQYSNYSIITDQNSAGVLGLNGQEYCKMVAPVYLRGVLKGYIVALKKNDTLLENLDTMAANRITDVYLIERDGTIIAEKRHRGIDNIGTDNFYSILRESLADVTDGNYYETQLKESIYSSDSGRLEIQADIGVSKIYFSQVAKSNGCVLLYVVPIVDLLLLQKALVISAIVFNLLLLLALIFTARVIIVQSERSQLKIEKLAYEDSMTGAPNENYFKKHARELLDLNPDLPYRVVSFDIQNFRYINEAYGHMKADHVLCALTEACAETFAYNETFARLSADRFVALVVNDGRNEARNVFMDEKMKKSMGDILLNFPIRIKRGYYSVNNHDEDVSMMIDKASLARTSIDTSTLKNNLESDYREDLMEATRRAEIIESRMESALADGEFVPYFQPKWDMAKDHICGAEALVRWKTAEGNIIPPNEFIPIFETNGFIEKLDFYMLESVCKHLRQMLDEGRAVFPVSVNQSRFLLHNPSYTRNIQDVLMKYKIPKGLLELEITETVFFQDRNHMIEVINELKELNLDISIDDFGSGFSSLNILREITFDVLKIDRDFITETSNNSAASLILRKVIEMAEGLGVKVICEGVETKEQVNMLLDLGCKYAQGYLYSRPIPLDEFIEKYEPAISE